MRTELHVLHFVREYKTCFITSDNICCSKSHMTKHVFPTLVVHLRQVLQSLEPDKRRE